MIYYQSTKINSDGTQSLENGNMYFYLRLDSFYETATFVEFGLAATLAEIGGLVSFLHLPISLIFAYIAKVMY